MGHEIWRRGAGSRRVWSRNDVPTFDPATEVHLEVGEPTDPEAMCWDDVAGTLRAKTSAECIAAKGPLGRTFLKNGLLPSLTGATTAAKLARAGDLVVADPAFSACVALLNTYEQLTAGDGAFLKVLWARKKTAAAGGLSAAEVTAIETAAATYGITLP